MKISPNLYGRMLMFSLVSRKFLAMRNITLYSVYSAVERLLMYRDQDVTSGSDTSIHYKLFHEL
jgi:hypothetical protein